MINPQTYDGILRFITIGVIGALIIFGAVLSLKDNKKGKNSKSKKVNKKTSKK